MKRLLSLFLLIPVGVWAHPAPSSDFSGEIDEAIAKYVEGIRNSKSIDLDDEKLRRIFGDQIDLQNQDLKSDEAIVEEDVTAADDAAQNTDDQQSFRNAGTQRIHVVQKGETLFAIARRYGIKPTDLVKTNSFLNDRSLYIGDKLTIQFAAATPAATKTTTTVKPKATTIAKLPDVETSSADNQWKKKQVVKYIVKKYTIKKGDTLSAIARNHKISLTELRSINDMKANEVIHPNQVIFVEKRRITSNFQYRNIFVQPVEGRLSSGFGRRRNPFVAGLFHFHKGIDLAAVIGTKFRAARDGIVVYSGRMQGYGNVIFLRHKDGYITVYGHNKLNLVKNGDIVHQGQIIGEVGRTGIATGPHLHFEVRKMDEVINPFVALKMQEVVPLAREAALK